MSDLINNQKIDAVLSDTKNQTKQLDKLLLALFAQIEKDYSHLSKLSYLMSQVKTHSIPIKTSGITNAARVFLGVEFEGSSFKVNRALSTSVLGDCASILNFKGEKEEKDPEVELRKMLRTLAKKAVKLGWNSDQFGAQALRAYEIEADYVNGK